MFCVQYIFLMLYVIEWHYGAKVQLYIWYLIVQGIFLSRLNYSGTSIQGTPSGLRQVSHDWWLDGCLSTIFVVSHLLSAEVSSECRLNLGFQDPEKMSLSPE